MQKVLKNLAQESMTQARETIAESRGDMTPKCGWVDTTYLPRQ